MCNLVPLRNACQPLCTFARNNRQFPRDPRPPEILIDPRVSICMKVASQPFSVTRDKIYRELLESVIKESAPFPGIYDMPTLLPQMMGFGSYFLQTSLGKILNQLHSKRLDEVAEQFESHRELMSPATVNSEGTEGTEGKESPAPTDPQGLDAVRRILETVNTSVTKQLLEANVRKLSTSPATMKREFEEDYQVRY